MRFWLCNSHASWRPLFSVATYLHGFVDGKFPCIYSTIGWGNFVASKLVHAELVKSLFMLQSKNVHISCQFGPYEFLSRFKEVAKEPIFCFTRSYLLELQFQ